MLITSVLTSNTSNSGFIASAFLTNSDAYKAFDNNTSTAWVVPSSSSATPASYTYWRMDNFVTNVWDGTWSISELQLGDASQTPYTSSSWTLASVSRPTDVYGGDPLKITDGLLNNWMDILTQDAGRFWVQWQFPSPVPVGYIRQGGWYGYRYINTLRLKGSNDGTNWVTVYEGNIDNLGGAYHQTTNFGNWTNVYPALSLELYMSAAINTYDYYLVRTQDASAAPTSWYFEGIPMDSKLWATIDTQSGVSGWVAGTPKIYNLTTNNKSYAGFRLRFPSIPSAGLNISEFSVYRNDTNSDLFTGGDILSGNIVVNTTSPRLDTVYRISRAGDIPVPDATGGVTVSRPVQGQLYPRGVPNVS